MRRRGDLTSLCWWACDVVDMVPHIPLYRLLFPFVSSPPLSRFCIKMNHFPNPFRGDCCLPSFLDWVLVVSVNGIQSDLVVLNLPVLSVVVSRFFYFVLHFFFLFILSFSSWKRLISRRPRCPACNTMRHRTLLLSIYPRTICVCTCNF